MRVEFIGTPGAGKTTLLPAVKEYFAAQGFNACSVVEAARPFAQRTLPGRSICRLAPQALQRPLLWQVFYHLSRLYRLKFFIRHPQLSGMVYSFQKRRPISEADRHHVLHWFFHLVGAYEFLNSHAGPEDVLIFDEGFVHRVVQLYASEKEDPDKELVLAYLDLVPRPDLVIFTDAPREICERRVIARGIWDRFRHKSPAEFSQFIANSHQVVNLAADYLKQKGWPVIDVDTGGDDPAAAQAELQRKLSNRAGFPPGFLSLQPLIQ